MVAELTREDASEVDEDKFGNLAELTATLSRWEQEAEKNRREYLRLEESKPIPVISYLQQCIEFATVWDKTNDVNWCLGTSSAVYHCSTAVVVGVAFEEGAK